LQTSFLFELLEELFPKELFVEAAEQPDRTSRALTAAGMGGQDETELGVGWSVGLKEKGWLLGVGADGSTVAELG